MAISKIGKPYAIVRFVMRHEPGALSNPGRECHYPSGLRLMRTLQGHIKVCPGGEARVGPRAGQLYDNYQLEGLINDEKDRLRELQLSETVACSTSTSANTSTDNTSTSARSGSSSSSSNSSNTSTSASTSTNNTSTSA